MARILIIGGYGAFGERAARRLVQEPSFEVIVAGRDGAKAEAAAQRLAAGGAVRTGHAVLDAATLDAAALAGLEPMIVINASGPFQSQDYRVAEAAMAIGAHYLDLADARAFVTGIQRLDAAAAAAGVLAVSGASTVPALSSAVVAELAQGLVRVTGIEIGISPGNSFDPGLATTRSILSYTGRPIRFRTGIRDERVFGWQGLGRMEIAGIGRRWMGHVELPDLDLLPCRYPDLTRLETKAGVEVGLFHLGLWALSGLVRAGLIADPARFAAPLLALKRRLAFLGTDVGGMVVALSGETHDGTRIERRWSLTARRGDGPYVPVIPAVILAKRLIRGAEKRRGAMACFGMFTLAEFMAEVADLAMSGHIEGPR